ncbi:MAG: hypothetical protein ACK4OM_06210 [Alphaproteobacteria bacterium]
MYKLKIENIFAKTQNLIKKFFSEIDENKKTLEKEFSADINYKNWEERELKKLSFWVNHQYEKQISQLFLPRYADNLENAVSKGFLEEFYKLSYNEFEKYYTDPLFCKFTIEEQGRFSTLFNNLLQKYSNSSPKFIEKISDIAGKNCIEYKNIPKINKLRVNSNLYPNEILNIFKSYYNYNTQVTKEYFNEQISQILKNNNNSTEALNDLGNAITKLYRITLASFHPDNFRLDKGYTEVTQDNAKVIFQTLENDKQLYLNKIEYYKINTKLSFDLSSFAKLKTEGNKLNDRLEKLEEEGKKNKLQTESIKHRLERVQKQVKDLNSK